MNEFNIIEEFFAAPARQNNIGGVSLGIGDDCALLTPQMNSQWAVSVDTLVENVHFPKNAAPALIAERALCVAISDLAAMGAAPRCFILALTMPEVKAEWLQDFSLALHLTAQKYHCALVGGDTTRGPLTISVQVMGELPEGTALTRSGARVGDKIFVTGPLGDGAAGLAVVQNRLNVDQQLHDYLLRRYYGPEPQLQAGQLLRQIASAAIDISDGLMADLTHICKASKVSAKIDVNKIPVTELLLPVVSKNQLQAWALTGGDDYQLCFTVPQQALPFLQKQIEGGLQAFEIGEVVTPCSTPVVLFGAEHLDLACTGYTHFD